MAIRVIEGVPGAGKTYYAVHHLCGKYFDWSADLGEYQSKVNPDDTRKLVVVTNIDRLRFGESLVIGSDSWRQTARQSP